MNEGTRVKTSRLLALLFISLVPAFAAPARPAFVVRTWHTYAPGATPMIETSFRDVSHLDFRIYKVNDPIRFFEQLKNPHQFGGPPPSVPQTPSLLERWHSWKRSLREEVRSFVRGQFSFAVRQAWVDRHERKRIVRRMPLHVSRFAQVPLLNRNQLVLSWRELLPRTRDWESRRIPVKIHGRGLYVVEAVAGELRAYTIVLITNLAVVTKASPGQMVIFVARRDSGEPVAGATTLVYADRKRLTTGTTDGNGLQTIPITGHKPQDMVVLARAGDDFAATDIASWYLSLAPQENWHGYLYTERPVYRPGQTVYFKGILRAETNGVYKLPTSREVTVTFKDADQKTFLARNFRLDAFGSFNGSFQLGVGVPLGQYSMQAQVQGVTGDVTTDASGSFSVEDYKRPQYAVHVTAVKPRVLEGESDQVDIQATYYYGSPVAGAQVKWAIYRSGYWSPLRWSLEGGSDFDDYFGDSGDSGDYYDGPQIGQGEGRLDQNGHLSITVPTSVQSSDQSDSSYRIVARVTDASNREISGGGGFVATYASFLAVVDSQRYVYSPGETAHFILRSVDYDGKPVAAQFNVVVQRWTDYGQNKPVTLYQAQAQTGADGQGSFDYTVPKEDSLEIMVTAHDAHGRAVTAQTNIWIDSDTSGTGQDSVHLVADRKTYTTGQTASVLVMLPTPSQVKGEAKPTGPTWILVTHEGHQVEASRIVKADGRRMTLKVPIAAADVPNFFLDVTYLKSGQLYTGEINLKVPPVEKKLKIAITTSSPVYKPRQTGTITVRVTDSQGHPVRAEVSLGVVDESVYAIEPEAAGNILRYFYQPIYNNVYTTFSTDYDFSGWAGRAALQLASLRPAYDLTDFKGQKGMAQPQVRKKFQETAYWKADLVTGADGVARAQVQFPDSLTSWRITARAVTRATEVGSAVANVITRKNLILQMALPRFAVQRDQFTIYSVVHNYLKQTKAVTMTMSAKGMNLANGAAQKATVATGGEARVAWQVAASTPGQATLLGEALTNQESDAVQLGFPVLPYGTRMTIPVAGDLREKTSASQTLTIPASSNPVGDVLDLNVTPSLSGTLFSSLNWLVEYPYGCTEQTVSAMVPDMVVNQALKQLHLPPQTSQDQLDARIRTGIRRLASSVNTDGGWGWWPSTPSDPFMTADAVVALAQARQAGYTVDASLLSGGVSSIIHFLNTYPRMVPDLRAWMVYAGEEAEPGSFAPAQLEQAYQQRGQMDAYGVALLALSLQAAHDSRAAAVAATLETMGKSNQLEAWWTLDDDPLLDSWYDTSPETTAWVLKALVELQPSSPLIPKAVRWLINHRDGGYWISTKQTAAIVDALTDYLVHSHALQPDFKAVIQVNGKTVLQRQFTAADVGAQPVQLQIPVKPGPVKITVKKQGAGVLYWSGAIHYASLDEHMQHMGSYKLNVVRQYYRLTPRTITDKENGTQVVYHPDPLTGPVKPGDLLLVRLTITGDTERYVMLEDPFPAGTEPVARDGLYTLDSTPPWYFQDWDRRELHDDHVSFFESYFPTGQQEFTYMLRVILPGTYNVMPARVGPMYDAGKLATSNMTTLQVKETKP